jgi:hypothetical protein
MMDENSVLVNPSVAKECGLVPGIYSLVNQDGKRSEFPINVRFTVG